MSSHKHLLYSAALPVLLLLAGGFLFVWPNYRAAGENYDAITELQTKAGALDVQRGQVEMWQSKLENSRDQIAQETKYIPDQPDIAGMMRRLSYPADHHRIANQTFTAGSETDALLGKETSFFAMPLTIEMEARFDSVFAVVRDAERMDRLVRVASLRMSCDHERKDGDPRALVASIGLEAIFEKPGVQTAAAENKDVER